jgi:hypothetical protein
MARHVSFLRSRNAVSHGAAGLAALGYPVVLVALALDVGFRHGGDMGEIAASFLGTILFLTAAPTAWIFAIDFIDVSRFTVIVAGILSSFPLWWLLGTRIAEGAAGWLVWLRRYATAVLLWTSFHLLAIGMLASLFG